MNKNEPPFLAIDYRILALDIKTDVNEKPSIAAPFSNSN